MEANRHLFIVCSKRFLLSNFVTLRKYTFLESWWYISEITWHMHIFQLVSTKITIVNIPHFTLIKPVSIVTLCILKKNVSWWKRNLNYILYFTKFYRINSANQLKRGKYRISDFDWPTHPSISNFARFLWILWILFMDRPV